MAFVGFADSQTGDAGLYAFDPATGQELWNVEGENLILPAPSYADGVVYFGDSDGKVYAVDVETQSVKPGWPFQTGEAIWGPVLVTGGRVYVAAMDHHVYCLDAESGQQIWQVEVGGAMAAMPALDAENGVLYVGAFDGRLYALDAGSGEKIEGFDFQAENWIWSEVLFGDDRLYVTSLDGRLYALDPSSGEIITPYPYDSGELAEGADVLRAAPVDAGEYIVVASEGGRVIAVNNGQRQWSWPSGIPEAAIYTTPVVSDGMIYVVLMNGQVQALDAETGNPGWSFSPPDAEE
jgi:outer membrane protein assembly factor BamB